MNTMRPKDLLIERVFLGFALIMTGVLFFVLRTVVRQIRAERKAEK